MRVDPANLLIHDYPHPVLRKVAKPIPAVTDEVRAVARKMIEMMYDEEGIGLAGPQVGLSWRIFVSHVPEKEGRKAAPKPPDLPSATTGPLVYINPVLSAPSNELEPYEEGCLSLPEIRGDVIRPTSITISALDIEGQPFTQTGTGLLARCWQHEYDHLDGVLIIDKFTQMSRLKTRAKVRELERDG